MRYTARLLGITGLERPVQVLGHTLPLVREWAEKQAKGIDLSVHPDGRVEISEMVERVIETIRPKASETEDKDK